MKFKGSDSPKIYVIDFHKEENPLEEYPLSGPRGAYVTSLFGSFSVLDKVRIANWTMQGKYAVVKDIEETKPEVVVAFGSEALTELVNTGKKITEVSGTVFDYEFNNFQTKLLVVTSPSYVLNRINDSEVALKFSQDLYKAFQIVNGEYVDILKEKKILSAHSFKEFKEIYDKYFKDDTRLAYDIETNARPSMFSGSKIIGFSIGNKDVGVYVSIDSLDFHMDREEEDDIWDFLINVIFKNENRKLIIHNTMYERPYTLYCKGYEIPFDKADDTLVMSRLLRSPKESAGLKYQAQKNLQYPDWETDLVTYIQGIRGLIDRIGFGPKKYEGLFYEMKANSVSIFELTKTEAFNKLGGSDNESLQGTDKGEVLDIINKIYGTVCDLYSEDELRDLGELIRNIVVNCVDSGGVKDSTIPYNWIPDRVLSKYGAVDSLATYDLYDFFVDMMNKESTDKVDLHKGYRNWLEHMYVAYIMERNGMYWNDEVASKDREFLSNQATECLRSMLKSPCFVPFIERTCSWKYKPIILSDYLPDIATTQGFTVKYDRVLDKYTLFYSGKRVNKGRIDEIYINRRKDEYYKLLRDMFYEEVDKAKDFEELKSLYNPSSTTSSDIPREILINDTLQMGGRITSLHTLSTSPEFETVKNSGILSPIDMKFLQIADLLCSPDKLKETFDKGWAKARKDLYDGFCGLYNQYKDKVSSYEILSILDTKCPVVIETFDDGGIITVYDNLVVTGMDQDDRSTWTPEFEWMINFRLFKKSAKLISSYIDGSVGRESVAIVDKDSVRRGDHCVERKDNYFSRKANSNEDYLLCAKWSPNTAETGRWRSAQHTVPWGSQVKKYYTSRFVGGTTCCPDYSQMEVRTLAAISKDANMLELFHSGKDFHTETAKKIYRKDEVTTAERRFSKTACWFGDTKIKLLDGSSMTIEEMYKSGKKDFDVYSFDIDEEHFRPGKTYDVQQTKIVTEYAEVSLDNGVVLKCTVDHPFLTRSGRYVKAEDLIADQKLESLFTRYSPRGTMPGYEQYFDTRYRFVCGTRNPRIHQTRCGKWIATHRTVFGNRNYGLQIDHINGKKYDNRPDNLQELSFVENRSKTRVRIELNDKFNSLPSIIKRMELMKSVGESLNDYDKYHTGLGDRFFITLNEYLPMKDIWENLEWYKETYLKVRRTEGCINTARSKRTEEPCRKVVKVEIKSCDPTPVYDLSVEKYHNYAVDLGDESAIFVHNTFSLLYGAMEESFARNYCNGDIDYANMVYGGFFEAYPGVKKWVEERHKEVQKDHRVSLELSGRFIPINPEGDGRGALNSMLRKSQNYPIQAQSADLTGCVIFDLQQYIEENNLKSLVFMYVHDSIEVDIYPYELFQFISKLKVLLNESPMRRMGLPSKADVALGKSLGHEIEMESIEMNEDMTEGTLVLKGYKDEIDDTVENWKNAYAVVEVSEENYKEEYVSMSELFILRKAYSPNLGTLRHKGTCKVHIKYYN